MKNFLSIIAFVSLLTSCASSRSGTASSAVKHRTTAGGEQPKFIENISITSIAPETEETEIAVPSRIRARKDVPGSAYSADIERSDPLQFKYAILLEESVETVTNENLISFLETWYGTPYRYGGESKKGIDCSAFTCVMMEDVFGLDLPRTAREQFKTGKRVGRSELMQGDLVFFNTTGGVSHVGVYLANNKFVHASASSGVMISDLDDAYFKRRYLGATRLR